MYNQPLYALFVLDIDVHTTVKYSVPSYERIAIAKGDLIGWYSIFLLFPEFVKI